MVLDFEAKSIHSFEDLCQSFIGHFISSRWQQKWFDSLHTIKQKEGESIRSFMNRFNVAILKVQNLYESIAMAAMMSGLLKNDLKKSLIKTYPRTLLNMLIRAEKYAHMEEAFTGDTPVGSTEWDPVKSAI